MLVNFWRWLGFHIHDWTDWEDYKSTRMPLVGGVPLKTMAYTCNMQRRTCKTCGVKETRSL